MPFKLDHKISILGAIAIALGLLGNWTATVSASAEQRKTTADLVTHDVIQDSRLDKLEDNNLDVMKTLSSLQTAQKYQTDMLKDIRDDIKDKKRGN